MKAIAINGSPMMDQGNTAVVLNPFLEGMREAGAEVELFYSKKLNINPCLGCKNCLFSTPGKCIQKDDMEMVLPKLAEADVRVFATPVYMDGMTGRLKNLIDRMGLPMMEAAYELRDDHLRHPMREGVKRGKVVLVSNCGLWEMDNFDPLVAHIKAICKQVDWEFAGALLRPYGYILGKLVQVGRIGDSPVDDILEAAKEAGRQLVVDGKMSSETLKVVSRQVLSREEFMDQINRATQLRIDAAKAK
ncbi:MAG: flavodoxin family protein [Syntrophobacteraceae bacterium]